MQTPHLDHHQNAKGLAAHRRVVRVRPFPAVDIHTANTATDVIEALHFEDEAEGLQDAVPLEVGHHAEPGTVAGQTVVVLNSRDTASRNLPCEAGPFTHPQFDALGPSVLNTVIENLDIFLDLYLKIPFILRARDALHPPQIHILANR